MLSGRCPTAPASSRSGGGGARHRTPRLILGQEAKVGRSPLSLPDLTALGAFRSSRVARLMPVRCLIEVPNAPRHRANRARAVADNDEASPFESYFNPEAGHRTSHGGAAGAQSALAWGVGLRNFTSKDRRAAFSSERTRPPSAGFSVPFKEMMALTAAGAPPRCPSWRVFPSLFDTCALRLTTHPQGGALDKSAELSATELSFKL